MVTELQHYAERRHGKGAWNQLLNKAGLENNLYLPLKEYPDTEVLAGLPTAAVLEDFGEFMGFGSCDSASCSSVISRAYLQRSAQSRCCGACANIGVGFRFVWSQARPARQICVLFTRWGALLSDIFENGADLAHWNKPPPGQSGYCLFLLT